MPNLGLESIPKNKKTGSAIITVHMTSIESSSRIESHIREKIINYEGDVVEYLISRFPEELQDGLYEKIADMNDDVAAEFLVTRWINRTFTLKSREAESLESVGIEVIKEIPHAIAEHIERGFEMGEEGELGQGKNGEVIRSINLPNTCYKVLFLERAVDLMATAAHEAYLQHSASTILADRHDVARTPKVLRFVDHKDLRAIHMDRIEGVSLSAILKGEAVLPENFDLENFSRKLENAIDALNQGGIFHRDLLENSGNIMIDQEGEPWIIDYGRALRSASVDSDGTTYQVEIGGPKMLSNDRACVEDFRRKLSKLMDKHD
jgi:predicted Ser/Thr protein kinase